MEHKTPAAASSPSAAFTLDPQALDEKYHFLLRKLHSLTGIIPIGVFLIEHLLTNSRAFHWFGIFNGGRDDFNKAVHGLHELPYLLALEVFGIFLPLAFHALYGIKIALSAEPNTRAYPYMANRRYTLQRITGYIAFVFIVVHLLKFRFAHLIGWGPSFLDPANVDKFEMTRQGLMSWKILGDYANAQAFAMPAWITLSFYVLGLWAACYHFANGIWTFCISWGITIGEKAQKRMGYFAALVGIVLFVWGSLSLYAFATYDTKASSEQNKAAAKEVSTAT
jgi:succinate dehydrogenase / fumarate reductase cytochrome b subunit